MRVVATIDDPVVVRKILTRLGLLTAGQFQRGPHPVVADVTLG